ncbi:hypothetical protein GCM10010191_63110 [Actinomadura vinacea]|uniref:Uncharacterized protein n=1 Tax=Actinomadura vinacea TaxID=115336 RepID=A0ABN3JTH5_9ACTN
MPEPEPDHRRQPPGDEPRTARSPLRLRAVLSAIALFAGAVAATVFAIAAVRGDGPGAWTAAAICAVVALTAAADLVVIARRAR